LFIDGARLANAAAHLDCSLADLAQYADVLSFGGTKNGALGAEAVVVMRPDLVADVKYLRKQQLQLASKMRFLSAQFLALMEDDLWRQSATHANEMARRLYQGVEGLPGIEVAYPVQSDAVFARLRPEHVEALQRDWYFYVWDEETSVVRWMTAFNTTETDVDQFVADIATVTGSR
jgi:threonine aldolase